MNNNVNLGGYDVSRETMDSLTNYVKILKKWNATINLVSKNSIKDVWKRHILDSAQLFKFANHDVKNWLDIGSGAGFPGLVIAILAKEKFRDLTFTLIESDKRKCVFLSEVVRELSLNVKTISKRIEDCSPQDADIISARALTQFEKLVSYFKYHGKIGSKGLFLKGKNVEMEIKESNNIDLFNIKLIPSEIDEGGFVIEVTEREY